MADVTLQQVLEALEKALATAMEKSVSARIPECGDFGGIAQDLDFCTGWLRANADRLAEKDAARLDFLERCPFFDLGGGRLIGTDRASIDAAIAGSGGEG